MADPALARRHQALRNDIIDARRCISIAERCERNDESSPWCWQSYTTYIEHVLPEYTALCEGLGLIADAMEVPLNPLYL